MKLIVYFFTVPVCLCLALQTRVSKVNLPLEQRLLPALSEMEVRSALVQWMIRSLKSEVRNGFPSQGRERMRGDFNQMTNNRFYGINQDMWPQSKLVAQAKPRRVTPPPKVHRNEEIMSKIPDRKTLNETRKKKTRPNPIPRGAGK